MSSDLFIDEDFICNSIKKEKYDEGYILEYERYMDKNKIKEDSSVKE